MTHIITGIGGFIGRNLARLIRSREPDSRVIGISRPIDLTDPKQALSAFEALGKADYIYHLADVSGNHKWAVASAFEQTLANCRMHLNVIEAWKKYQPQAKLVFPGSMWAYPESSTIASESEYWSGPLIPEIRHYGHSKQLADILIDAACRENGLKGSTLVLGTTFGPGDKSDHFIPSIIRKMAANPAEVTVHGTGSEARDFVYIDDQVLGIYLHRNIDARMLNISSGKLRSLREVVDILVQLLDYPGSVVYRNDANRGGGIRGLSVDTAKRLTGWSEMPKLTPLDVALKTTINDIKNNG